MTMKVPKKNKRNAPKNRTIDFRLYVFGNDWKSLNAISNLKKICREHLIDKCRISIIDILHHPDVAKIDQIIALPTLIKTFPLPIKTLHGDLSNTQIVLSELGVPTKARA